MTDKRLESLKAALANLRVAQSEQVSTEDRLDRGYLHGLLEAAEGTIKTAIRWLED